MKKIIITFVMISVSLIYFYGCSEESNPSTTNTNSSNSAPNLPANPSPPDNTEDLDTNNVLVVSWTCSDPNETDTLTYDLYKSTIYPPDNYLIASNLTNPVFGVGIVYSNTTYFWRVVAKDNHGATRSGNIWRFKTRVY